MKYKLHVAIEGNPQGGGTYGIDPARLLVIGRRDPSDVKIPLPEVSSRHAQIMWDPGEESFVLTDLGSKIGTFVNAERIAPGEARPLSVGEVFQVGHAFVRIEEAADVPDMAPKGAQTMIADPALMAGLADAGSDTPEAAQTVLSDALGEIAERLQDDAQPPQPPKPAGDKPAPKAEKPRGEEARSLSTEVQQILLRRVDLSKIVQEAGSDAQARTIVREQIGYVVNELHNRGRIDADQVTRVEKDAFDDILGFGPIQDLMDDPNVSEIMVNRPDQIYFEDTGKLKLAERSFQNDRHVQQILRRLLRNSQRRIDESSPTVNATLPDGSRLHAVIPPISLNGSTITIRKFSRELTIDQLVSYGSLTRQMADLLELAVEHRQNIVVSGGTGSGKTTLLNVLSACIPDDQRVITIEDTAELNLHQPHVVRLQARPSNTEGVGLVSIQQLVVEALRMRPDRIVVGECRHAEALDMLQAMNTGHDGSLTTVHSNSAGDALHRLETMVLLSGLELPMSAIREQIRSAVHLIVHAERLIDGSRRVVEVIEITELEEGEILYQPVYQFVQEGMDGDGKILGRHRPTGYIPQFLNIIRQQGHDIPEGLFSM